MALRGGQKDRVSLSQAAAAAGEAPPEPVQTDLEQLIAESKRAETERQRFQASQQATQRRDELANRGRLAGNRYVGIVEQISAYTDREKAKRKRKNVVQNYNGPTPERAAKTENGFDSDIAIRGVGHGTEVRSYTVRAPLTVHKDKLSDSVRIAAARFLKDYDAAELGGKKLISSYDGIPGGAYGARSGGVADNAREAKARMMLLESLIGADGWNVLESIVAMVSDQRAGRPRSLAEIGYEVARYNPTTNKDQALAAGIGVTIACLWFVRGFYAREDALRRGDASTAEEIRARLQIRRERIAREQRRGNGATTA